MQLTSSFNALFRKAQTTFNGSAIIFSGLLF